VSVRAASVVGSLRREADVGFTTCSRGHRIVVHRVGRSLARIVPAANSPFAAQQRPAS
jgi:hypothetical protein